MLAKIHHSILQSWPVTTASIAMPKLEEGAGQAKLSQARGGLANFAFNSSILPGGRQIFFVCVSDARYTLARLSL